LGIVDDLAATVEFSFDPGWAGFAVVGDLS
jgi:hypothetical protein